MKRYMNYNLFLGLVLGLGSLLLSCTSGLEKTQDPGKNESAKQSSHQVGDQDHHHDETSVPEPWVELSAVQARSIHLTQGMIEQREMSSVLKVTGQTTIYPNDRAEVSTYIGANVQKIYVYQGDKVKKGQVLALLEHPDFIVLQSDYITAYNQYTYLAYEYTRQKALFDQKVGSEKTFQKISSEYAVAKSQYMALKARLDMLGANTDSIEKGHIARHITIVSPINGTVIDVNISLGRFVSADSHLFVISNLDRLHVDLTVYDKDIAQVKPGQHVLLNHEKGGALMGRVFSVAKEFDPKSKAVLVHVNLDEPLKNPIVGHFMTGEIWLDTLLVPALPESAVVHDEGQAYIFVALGDQAHDGAMRYVMKEVVLGKKHGEWQQVTPLELLDPKAKIVYTGAYYMLSELLKGEAGHSH